MLSEESATSRVLFEPAHSRGRWPSPFPTAEKDQKAAAASIAINGLWLGKFLLVRAVQGGFFGYFTWKLQVYERRVIVAMNLLIESFCMAGRLILRQMTISDYAQVRIPWPI